MIWCIQNVVILIICTPVACLRSILYDIPYKQKIRNRKEIGFNMQYEQFNAFFSSLVLRMVAVSIVYVTSSSTSRHNGFHHYKQFSYILGGFVLPKSLYTSQSLLTKFLYVP